MTPEKPTPPAPDFRSPSWWAAMAEWLEDERPMSDRDHAEAMASCKGIPTQRELF